MKQAQSYPRHPSPYRYRYRTPAGRYRLAVERPTDIPWGDCQRLGIDWNESRAPESPLAFNGTNYAGEKETIRTAKLVLKRDATATAIEARWYMARSSDGASPVYCTVWFHRPDGEGGSSSGTAKGYGYDKESSALELALTNAGFSFRAYFGGVGEAAMRAALSAAARALGWRGKLTIV